MRDKPNQPWSPEQLAGLLELWGTGISTAEIGRRIGKSKNSVVGKAHRLNLEKLPNPIKPPSDVDPAVRKRNNYYAKLGRTPPPPRAAAATLPALASIKPVVAHVREAKPVIVPFVPRKTAPKLPSLVSNSPCCWPLGDPKEPDFKFCGKPSKLGKPYCSAHCDVAYIKVRDRREDDVIARLQMVKAG